MHPSYVKFGSSILLPFAKMKGRETQINNTPYSAQLQRLFVRAHCYQCVFERAYMHGTSLSLWFNMHNWSIHYCKTGAACCFQRREVVGSDLEGQRFATPFTLVIRSRRSLWGLFWAGSIIFEDDWFISDSCRKIHLQPLICLEIKWGGLNHVSELVGPAKNLLMVASDLSAQGEKIFLLHSTFTSGRDFALITPNLSKFSAEAAESLATLWSRGWHKQVNSAIPLFAALLASGLNKYTYMSWLTWQSFRCTLWHHQKYRCHVF